MKQKMIYAIGTGSHDSFSYVYYADTKELAEKALRHGGWDQYDHPRIYPILMNINEREIRKGFKLYLVHISKKTQRARYLMRVPCYYEVKTEEVEEFIAIVCWAKNPADARTIAKIKAKPFLNKIKKSNDV